MKFYVKDMVIRDGEMVNPCGSDYGMIIHDLKTLKGVLNRVRNFTLRKDVVEIHIYQCGINSLSDERLIHKITNLDGYKRCSF